MKKELMAVAMALSCSVAFAATSTEKASYEAAKKEAATRYASDRKLCADESTSSVRMQCLRDAKTEYNQSLADAKTTYNNATATKTAAAANDTPATCNECGRVTGVKVVDKKGKSTPLGMIAGGVAGAVLGHQVGGGRGQDVATVAGAAGGAYAGHKIEENVRSTKVWTVNVHFENGDDKTFEFASDPGYTTGDAVRRSGDGIVRR